MRLILCLLMLLFVFVGVADAQFPFSQPTQYNKGFNRWGYAMSDSGTIIANRDTNWLPKYSGTLIYRPSDKKFYYYDSTEKKWSPLASDTTGSVNDKFNNLAALAAEAVKFPVNTILSTKGFYEPNDGGECSYIITTDTIAGLAVDGVSQIRLSNGLFARIYHNGSVRWEQFGAIGDSATNEMPYFEKGINFIRKDRTVNTIRGTPNKIYRLLKLSTNPSSFEENCFLRLDFGEIIFDFAGCKVIFDNNATQSYVYHADGAGVVGVYRCKQTNVGHTPTKVLFFGEFYWQLMKDSVTDTGEYPVWSADTTYYGAMDFVHAGFGPGGGTLIKNIKWTNMELSGAESDSISVLDGYWNLNAKAFFDFENLKNVTWDNVKMHNVISEVVYGGGTDNIGGYVVKGCEIYNSHNAISHGGDMRVENNIIHDCAANAVESFPYGVDQYYEGNKIYNCKNGITVGGPGNDINVQSYVNITGNRIYDCSTYGIYLSGKLRGATIHANEIYDNFSANISLYALSNLGFPMVNSDVIISNNIIGCYRLNVNCGITLNSSHADADQVTGNINITGNTFGRLKEADVEGINSFFNSGIEMTSDKYSDIAITGNHFTDGVKHSITYILTGDDLPYIKHNNYTGSNFDAELIAANSVMDYTTFKTFAKNNIRDELTTLELENFNTPVYFFKTPSIADIGKQDFDGVYLISLTGHHRLILLPGTDDNLTRSKILFLGAGTVKGAYIRYLHSIQSDPNQRQFEYYFSNNNTFLSDVVVPTANTSGTVANNDSITVSLSMFEYYYVSKNVPFYDQYSFDSTASSNLPFDPNFQVRNVAMNGCCTIDVTLKNISGGSQNIDSKNVTMRVYPMSNPAYLPVSLQPLRKEGRTNMRPVGSDVPNGFVFWDTEIWKYIKWDSRYQTWVDANSPNVSYGVAAPSSTPQKAGDMYVDTVGKKIYVATGSSSSADWTIVN